MAMIRTRPRQRTRVGPVVASGAPGTLRQVFTPSGARLVFEAAGGVLTVYRYDSEDQNTDQRVYEGSSDSPAVLPRREVLIAKGVTGMDADLTGGGVLRVTAAVGGVIREMESTDSGRGFGMPTDMAGIGPGYDLPTTALEERSGASAMMLYRRDGKEWYCTVGQTGVDGVIAWSSPRATGLKGEPVSGTLICRGTGEWQFTYRTASGPRIAVCTALRADGSGEWK